MKTVRLEYERLISSVGISLLKTVPLDFTGQRISAGALEGDGVGQFLATDKGYR